MRKILITGSTGMLGAEIIRLFKSSNKFEVFGLASSLTGLLPPKNQFVFDIADTRGINGIPIVPDVIIHTAALTDLGLCEEDPRFANNVNVIGTQNVARLGSLKTIFFYISTDSVFDGKQGNYSEGDRPNPLNSYADSKLRGEKAALEEHKGRTCIIRTNIYGFHLPVIKNSLVEWAFKEWSAGKRISGFTDTVFNAVFVRQLASILQFMIDNDVFYPILNVGSDRAISKFGFLDTLRKELAIEKDMLSESVSSDFASRITRPKNTSLSTSLLSGFYKVPQLENGISGCIEQAKLSTFV